MAVVIADNRSVWSDCNTADWGGSTADTVYTTAPDPKELTGCLGFGVSEATEYVYYVGTSVDLSAGVLIYAWSLVLGTEQTIGNGGRQVVVGDGTNINGYYRAGSDESAFRHDEGGVNWQCMLIDTSTLPTGSIAHEGTLGNLTLASITQIGTGYVVDSKALGGGDNCYTDVVFQGNDGLTITGGGTGTEGKFSEIATVDASDTQGASSFGICRQLGAGLIGLQGPLFFGSTAALSLDFYDTNTIINFEDRQIGTDKYHITIQGNTTGDTTFQLGDKVGSTGGQNGCTVAVPEGVGGYWQASGNNVDRVYIYGTLINGFSNGVSCSLDTTSGSFHEYYGNSFNGCGMVDPGKVQFKNNGINSSTDSSGSLLIDSDGTTNIADLSFTSDGTGHAVYITETGSYDFTDFVYSGFASVNGSTGNEAVYNNSGGAVTINVAGGEGATSIRNGTSASTTVNNNVSITVSGLYDLTEVRVLASGSNTELAGIENATDGTTDDRSFTFSLSAALDVKIVIHNLDYVYIAIDYTIPGSTAEIPVQQQFDRYYLNP